MSDYRRTGKPLPPAQLRQGDDAFLQLREPSGKDGIRCTVLSTGGAFVGVRVLGSVQVLSVALRDIAKARVFNRPPVITR